MKPILLTLWLALFGPAPPQPSPRRRSAFRRPLLEVLEVRTLPAPVTILGSHLISSGGIQEFYGLPGFLSVGAGDRAVNLDPGTYSVLTAAGTTFGTFTVTNQDNVAGVTGALVTTGNAVDFDLTQLAAVTINAGDVRTASGAIEWSSIYGLTNQVGNDDTFYVPVGTYTVWNNANPFSTFTVAASGSGSLVVSGTTCVLVATGNTIDFDLTQLAAVTINAGDLTSPQGEPQLVALTPVSGGEAHDDTIYLPAGTYSLFAPAGQAYGSFTVTQNGSGSFTAGGTTGALVATGNNIDFDLKQLAAITVNELIDPQGNDYEFVGVPVSQGIIGYYAPANTYNLPTGNYQVETAAGTSCGTFTVGQKGSGAFVIGGTTGALLATGNTITIDPNQLAEITINNLTRADGQPEFSVLNGIGHGFFGFPDQISYYVPAGTYSLNSVAGPAYGTFTVTENVTGGFVISGTTDALTANGDTINVVACALNAVTITPSPQLNSWSLGGVTNGGLAETVYIPDGTYQFNLNPSSGGSLSETFSVGPNGLTATELPASSPLVSLQLVPCQDETTTTVAASADPSMLNQPVTFTADVTVPDGDVATGSVQFVIDGVNFGAPVALTSGSASTTTAALGLGPHTITAVYSGGSEFDGSTGSANATVIPSASLSGLVWEDFNDDGQVDFGENGISGVTITLSGADEPGNTVNQSQVTDSDGAYVFLNLRPGNYYLTEAPPAGYVQGIDSVGTAGGSVSATDQFFVALGVGVNGLNYNFGELPPAGGSVPPGQTATIGFWNNKNGQALIKSFNGGMDAELADWLAATLPNSFGASAGANNLTGKSNASVAALFQKDFLLKGVKLDAQVLATALNVYATNAMLDATGVAAQYGFTVNGNGAGTSAVNVGSNGAAFGVADGTLLTVLDLLKATDAQAIKGVLYNGDVAERKLANAVYSAVNQEGDIG
jgi:hypothetical protein